MNNSKKTYGKIVAISLLVSLIVSLVSGVAPYSVIKTAKAAYNISNPRVNSNTTTWDCIYFGNYWQNDTNGDGKADSNDSKQPIKWRVLSVNGNEAFIVADKALDCKKYNETFTSVTWETCTLRTWLNGTFYNNAFNAIEQAAIKTTNVINEDNISDGTAGGNDTSDRIFLLSQNEVRNSKYGFNSEYNTESDTRISVATAYAKANNCWTNSSGSCYWWLRSPGNSSTYAAEVDFYGGGDSDSYVDDDGHGVRPTLNINLSSDIWKSAGTVSAEIGSGSSSGSSEPTASASPTATVSPTASSTSAANTTNMPTNIPSGSAATAPTATAPPATPSTITTTPLQDTKIAETPVLSGIKINSVICKKKTKKITVRLSVKGATVKIKVGRKAYRKATAKNKTYTLKLGYRLKKGTKVIVKVTKKNYAGLKKSYKVK